MNVCQVEDEPRTNSAVACTPILDPCQGHCNASDFFLFLFSFGEKVRRRRIQFAAAVKPRIFPSFLFKLYTHAHFLSCSYTHLLLLKIITQKKLLVEVEVCEWGWT